MSDDESGRRKRSRSDERDSSDDELETDSTDNKKEDQTVGNGDQTQSVMNKPEIMNRNKRMFGSLMGHLGLAKKTLEKDSDLINKQVSVTSAVLQKNLEESKRLSELRYQSNRAKMVQQKKMELERHTKQWRSQVEVDMDLLFTATTPVISWSPVQHNEQTAGMLELRKSKIMERIAHREQEDARKLAEFESSGPSNHHNRHNEAAGREQQRQVVNNGNSRQQQHRRVIAPSGDRAAVRGERSVVRTAAAPAAETTREEDKGNTAREIIRDSDDRKRSRSSSRSSRGSQTGSQD